MISCIVPVFNGEKYIDKCISSILKQTYEDFELIIIDDGSFDKTKEIIQRFLKDVRLKYIQQSNQGVSVARNNGLKIAKGEWITFVDADDWIDEAYFTNVSKWFSDYQAIRCGYRLIKKRKIDYALPSGEFSGNTALVKILMREWEGFACAWMIHRDLIKDHKFHEDIVLMEDTIFICECLENIDRVRVDEHSYYNYVYQKESATARKADEIIRFHDYEKSLLYLAKRFCYLDSIEQYISASEIILMENGSAKCNYIELKQYYHDEMIIKAISNSYTDYLDTRRKIFLSIVKTKSTILIYFYHCIIAFIKIIFFR